MKIRPALYLLCGCLVFSHAFAQEAKPLEPEMMRLVYFLDSTDQILKPLPRETAKIVAARGAFSNTAKGSAQIPGPASTFRLKGGKDFEFVVQCTNPEHYELHAFKKKGNNREAVLATTKIGWNQKETVQREGAIAFDMAKYGQSSYRFVVKGLAPGEYAFLDGANSFDFAVDAP